MERPSAPKRWRTILAHRVCAGVVALAVGVATTTVWSAPEPDAGEIERLYVEGQDKAEAKDFTGAAESWTRLINLLPESGANRETREAVIINILDAHINAYNRILDSDGTKNPQHLNEAKSTLDDYYRDYTATHGDLAVGSAVQKKADELKLLLEDVSDDTGGVTETDTDGDDTIGDDTSDDTTTGLPPPPPPPPSKTNGMGLLVGGSVVSALGIGAFTMIPIGSIRGKRAEDDFNEAVACQNMDPMDPSCPSNTDDAKEQADFEGKQANQVLIAGAILGPLLLAGGVVMIYFGVKKYQASKFNGNANKRGIDWAAPQVGRNYAGFGFGGKF